MAGTHDGTNQVATVSGRTDNVGCLVAPRPMIQCSVIYRGHLTPPANFKNCNSMIFEIQSHFFHFHNMM